MSKNAFSIQLENSQLQLVCNISITILAPYVAIKSYSIPLPLSCLLQGGRQGVIGVARATPIFQVFFQKTLSHQTHKPQSPQILKPTSPQTHKPSSSQTHKPSSSQPLKPSSPHTPKPSSPQALKPLSTQALKHSNQQALKL